LHLLIDQVSGNNLHFLLPPSNSGIVQLQAVFTDIFLFTPLQVTSGGHRHFLFYPFIGQVSVDYRAAIQRRGSILSWSIILSVYGADTIAIDLSLSALIF
jgi:hypothetical protein